MKLKESLVAFLFILAAKASVGDSLPEFQDCFADCRNTLCVSPLSASSKYQQDSISPLAVRLFSWDCDLDCDYKCQQIVSRERKQAGLPMVQFEYLASPSCSPRCFHSATFLSIIETMARSKDTANMWPIETRKRQPCCRNFCFYYSWP